MTTSIQKYISAYAVKAIKTTVWTQVAAKADYDRFEGCSKSKTQPLLPRGDNLENLKRILENAKVSELKWNAQMENILSILTKNNQRYPFFFCFFF